MFGNVGSNPTLLTNLDRSAAIINRRLASQLSAKSSHGSNLVDHRKTLREEAINELNVPMGISEGKILTTIIF